MNFRTFAHTRLVILTMLCVTLCSTTFGERTASAQSTDGRLIVTVRDAVGDVIPNATVTIVNDQTRQEFTGTTTEAGIYALSQVPVASYTVTVTAPNFQTKI